MVTLQFRVSKSLAIAKNYIYRIFNVCTTTRFYFHHQKVKKKYIHINRYTRGGTFLILLLVLRFVS